MPLPRSTVVVGLLVLLLCYSLTVYAATPCVKTSFKGTASTYNPNKPGWKTGGQGLATGGRYNPNAFEAALQLGLAKQYRCGYGSGAICNAVVQAPNGRGMIVRINDNGPLVSGRVIDLNEKSMRYLSGGSSGNNSGLIPGVTVTLLCGIEGATLGPLDPKDREMWANLTFDAPYANTSGYSPSPFANLSPWGGGQPVGQSSGTSFPQSAAPVNAPVTSPNYQTPTTPTGSSAGQSSQTPISSSLGGTPYAPSSNVPSNASPPALSLVAQPSIILRGAGGIVSWTSLGAATNPPCRVTVISGGREVFVGEGPQGTKPIQISANSTVGTMTFKLRCASLAGDPVERTASISVK